VGAEPAALTVVKKMLTAVGWTDMAAIQAPKMARGQEDALAATTTWVTQVRTHLSLTLTLRQRRCVHILLAPRNFQWRQHCHLILTLTRTQKSAMLINTAGPSNSEP
jgi:hypothetical protein